MIIQLVPTKCSHRCARWAHEDWTVSDLLGQCKTKKQGKEKVLYSLPIAAFCLFHQQKACLQTTNVQNNWGAPRTKFESQPAPSVQVQLLSRFKEAWKYQSETEGSMLNPHRFPSILARKTSAHIFLEDSTNVSVPRNSRSCPTRQGS